jgi:hypothetical protein
MEIAIVFQMTGGAIFVSIAQSIFSNLLLSSLVTDVDPIKVLETGASELRQAFHGAQLDDVLNGYLAGLRGSFALGLALALAAVVLSVVPPIRSIKKTGKPTPSAAAA